MKEKIDCKRLAIDLLLIVYLLPMLQSVTVNGFVGHRLICEACGKEVWCYVRVVGAKTDDIDTHDVASPEYLFEYTQESEIPQSAGFGHAYRRHYRRVEHVEVECDIDIFGDSVVNFVEPAAIVVEKYITSEKHLRQVAIAFAVGTYGSDTYLHKRSELFDVIHRTFGAVFAAFIVDSHRIVCSELYYRYVVGTAASSTRCPYRYRAIAAQYDGEFVHLQYLAYFVFYQVAYFLVGVEVK